MTGNVISTDGSKTAKKLPKKSPVVRKLYFVSITPDGKNKLFRHNAYSLLEGGDTSMHLTLIHYLGNEKTTITDYPHGNSKSDQPKAFDHTYMPISAEIIVWKT